MALLALLAFNNELSELIQDGTELKSPTVKERRQFICGLSKCLKERFVFTCLKSNSFILPAFLSKGISYSKTQQYGYTDGLTGSKFRLLMIRPYWLTLERLRLDRKVLSIKVSDTSRCNYWSCSTRKAIVSLIKMHIRAGGTASLHDLLPGLYAPHAKLINDVTGPIHSSLFFQDLLQGLCRVSRGQISLLAFARKFRKEHTRHVTADLKVRYYFERADYRAFVIDRNLARALSGAIIQKIFGQSKTSKSKHRGIEVVMPYKGSNVIHITLKRLDVATNLKTDIGQGDISSFTSSNPNSWFTVLIQLLLLSEADCEHLRHNFVVTVDGWPIEVDIITVLKIYVHTVLFMSVHDCELDEDYFQAGGCLGVNANITLTKFAFAITMVDLIKIAKNTYNVSLWVRVSGDDFFYVITGQNDRVDIVHSMIRSRITGEVGHLKTLDVLNVSGLPLCERHGVGKFCKKFVYLRRTTRGVHSWYDIQTKGKLPIMTQLLMPTLANRRLMSKAFEEMMYGVRDQLRHQTYIRGILAVYQHLFCEIHGLHFTWRQHHSHIMGADLSLYIKCEDSYLSSQAFTKACTVADLETKDGFWRTRTLSKARFLTNRNALRGIRGADYTLKQKDRDLEIILSRRETDPRTHHYTTFIPLEDARLFSARDACFSLLIRARELIKENL